MLAESIRPVQHVVCEVFTSKYHWHTIETYPSPTSLGNSEKHSSMSASCIVPTFLLRFRNPMAEREFYKYFVDSLRAHDRFATYLFIGTALSINKRVGPLRFFHVIGEFIVNSLLLYLQSNSRRNFYTAHRTAIIAGVRVARFALVIFFAVRPSAQEFFIPLFTSMDFHWTGGVLWKLLMKPSLPILQSFGFLLPFCHQLWLQFLLTVGLAVFSDPRCVIECSRNPSFYSTLYSSTFNKVLAPLQKLKLPELALVEPFEFNCRQQCNVVNIFLAMFLGYLAPTLILAAIEETTRLRALREFGGSPLLHKSKVTLFYSLLLLPLMAIITLEVIYVFIFLLI